MGLYTAAGARVTKASFPATTDTCDPVLVVTQKLYATRLFGTCDKKPEGSIKTIAFNVGDRFKQSEIDKLFPLATITSVLPATGGVAGGWVSVDIETCNALHSCSTGSGPGVPPMTPTTAKPPLGMAVLHRISVDPDVISTAATHMALPGRPYRSSASPTPTSHGSSTPPTPSTPVSPSPSSGG
jgi:hypothetical protein